MTKQRPTRRQLDDIERNQFAFPLGPPDTRWTDQELASFLAHSNAEIAALQPMTPLLALEDLSNEELEILVTAKSKEHAQALEQQFAAAKQPRPRKKVKVTQ